MTATNDTLAAFWWFQYLQFLNNTRNETQVEKSKVCADSVNEEYLDCGKRCVLGCFVDSSVESRACNTVDSICVEGCFCKTGLIRHRGKCIKSIECPTKKCQDPDEIYVSLSAENISAIELIGIFSGV